MVLDLRAKSFNVIQTSINPGQDIDLLFGLENMAVDIAEGVEVKFYISNNDWISEGDYEIGSYTINNIGGSDDTGILQTTVTLPEESEQFWRLQEDGTYFVGMLIQDTSYRYEQYSDHDEIEVMVAGVPDLTGESFAVKSLEPVSDNEVGIAEVEYSIFNQGKGDAGTFLVDFYLSTNDYISTDDYYLGYQSIESLAANTSTGNLTTSFNLPEASNEFWSPDGANIYHIGAIVNQSSAIDETFKFSNNSNQGELIDSEVVTIEHESWVDLEGASFNISPEDIALYQPGGTLYLDFAIRNKGLNDVEGDFNVGFYLSTDPEITQSDTVLGSYLVPDGSLSAKGYFNHISTLTLPSADDPIWDSNPDRFFVGMVVDKNNQIAETNEENNTNTEELSDFDGTGSFLDNLRSELPDMTMNQFDVNMAKVEAGETIDIEFALANLGKVEAESFNVDFYISDNEYISTNDYKIGSYEVVEGLLPGMSASDLISQTFNLPEERDSFWLSKGNGTYYVAAIIDSEDKVDEYKNFSNNVNVGYKFDIDTVKVHNPVLVDLEGKHFEVVQRHSVESDDFINVGFEIANTQEGNSGQFTVEFYISDNEYISTNDTKIGEYEILSVAGHSTTGLLSATYSLPAEDNEFWENWGNGSDGTYYVGMLIDSEDTVPELTKLNNNNMGQDIDSDTVEVVGLDESGSGDLLALDFNVIEEADEATPLLSGEEFNVEYTIYNDSGDDIFFGVAFYLFTEDYLNSNETIKFEDCFDPDSGLTLLFFDRDSSFIEMEAYERSEKLTTDLKIPEKVTEGYYYIGMVTDQWGEVSESDETNNSLTAEFIDYERVFIDEGI